MSSEPPSGPLGERDQLLRKYAAEIDERYKLAKSPLQQETDDRSWIVRWTVGGFCLYIILVVATVLLRGFYPSQLGDAVAIEVELLKTAIMPLMTLVLGYFFSRPNR